MKKRIIEIITQIIPVMIGVYLGFVVTEWTNNQKTNNQTQQLVASIKLEIESNENWLLNVKDYHKMLRDTARYYSSSMKHPETPPTFFKGTRMPFLMNSAFETGVQTGLINELNLDIIQSLNKLYTLQNSYNDYSNMLLSSFINKELSLDVKSMQSMGRFLAVTMADVVIKEENLLEGYENIKNSLAE